MAAARRGKWEAVGPSEEDFSRVESALQSHVSMKEGGYGERGRERQREREREKPCADWTEKAGARLELRWM